MKTARDFQKSIGDADEAFAGMVLQTLRDLQCKEEKPVKKKISTGLVLAVVIMLLAVGAVAAGQWGILDFAKEHGEAASPDRLVTQINQGVYRTKNTYVRPGESELVDVALEEILYEDGWLYAALLVTPKQEKTMVIGADLQTLSEQTGQWYLNALGKLRDLNEPDSMKAFAAGMELAPDMSIKEYADSMGFEHVVRVSLGMFIKHADYQLLEDGSLRMIAQIAYDYTYKENFPRQMPNAWISLDVVQYTADGKIPEDMDEHEFMEIQADGPIVKDPRSKCSIPEDAHQIEGYRGYIESVTVTPLSDTQASVLIQLDTQKRHYGVTQMAGPVVVILDEKGEPLFECDLYRDIESMVTLTGDRMQHNIVMPRAGLQEDRITIRLESWRNRTVVYDEYTYTLE